MPALAVTARPGTLAPLRRLLLDLDTVPDLRHGLARLRHGHHDAVLLHLQEAGLDGLRVLRTEVPHVAVVVLVEDEAQCLQAITGGAQEVVEQDRLEAVPVHLIRAVRRVEAEQAQVHRDATQEAGRRSASLADALVNDAAHELATPLTPLALRLRTLRGALGRDDQEAALAAVEAMERSAKRLQGSFERLLACTRLRARLEDLRPREVDLAEHLSAALGEVRRVRLERGPGPATVQVDPEAFTEALSVCLAPHGPPEAIVVTATSAHVLVRARCPGGSDQPLSARVGRGLLEAVVAPQGGAVVQEGAGPVETTVLLRRVRAPSGTAAAPLRRGGARKAGPSGHGRPPTAP